MGYNWFIRQLVTFIKTGSAVAKHVFDFRCDTRPVDMFSCLGDTLFNALVSQVDWILNFST